jgi:hypothetical protein
MKKIRKFNESSEDLSEDMIVHPILENTCYVAHQGIADLSKLFNGKRVDLYFYPETDMSALERYVGVKYVKSIVTESAELICCYDSNNVYIWENGQWINPRFQTYGTSFRLIESRLLKFTHDICLSIIGGESKSALVNTIKKIYE